MPKITLILHNIRSTHNVGSIFRTAEGFGVEEIILSGYTPYPKLKDKDVRLPHISEKLTSQIHKTALGAENLVPFRYFENIEDWLSQNTLPLIALEQSKDSINLKDFKAFDSFALILGEEVNGIEDELLKRSRFTLEIPMFGQKESFNVSVAAGIVLFSLVNK